MPASLLANYPGGTHILELNCNGYILAARVVVVGRPDSGYSIDFIRRTLNDKTTGVSVNGDGIANVSRLIVQPNKLHAEGTCPACDEIRRRNPLAVYDISLTNGHSGSVEVYIPFSGDGAYTVLHCNNGVLEAQSALYANGGVTTTWRKLSPFAVVKGAGVSVPQTIVVDPPKTGADGIGYLALLCAGFAGLVILRTARSKRTTR